MLETILFDHVDLPEREAALLEGAMRDLPACLGKAPLGITLETRHLPRQMNAPLMAALSQSEQMADISLDFAEFFADSGQIPLLLIGCPENHRLAAAARANNSDALWGGTIGRLALVYPPRNPYAVWHEALHLLVLRRC